MGIFDLLVFKVILGSFDALVSKCPGPLTFLVLKVILA